MKKKRIINEDRTRKIAERETSFPSYIVIKMNLMLTLQMKRFDKLKN